MNSGSAISGIVTNSRSAPKLAVVISALTLLTLILLCLGNSALPLIDRDEPRFAEASREMLQNGNWTLPRFNNQPRYDKPPLVYWMQAFCYKALGQNNFSARLPSAACMALCVALVSLWAASLTRDPQTASSAALRAGAMFALCPQVFVHGRAAVADPPMVLFFVASAWAGWRWLRGPTVARCLLFWVLLALGFLAKGPVAWIPLGMVLLGLRRPAEAGRRNPPGFQWMLGICVLLLLIGLWGVPALIQTQGEFARVGLGKHVVARSLVSLEGHGARSFAGYLLSLPFYFLTIFISFAPWAWWLPPALPVLWRTTSAEVAYLCSGVWITFGVFTVSRTKLPHYTLPALPLLAILLALWWESARSARLWKNTTLATFALFVFLPASFRGIAGLSVTENLLHKLTPQLGSETQVRLVDYEEPSLIWGLRSRINDFPGRLAPMEVNAWLESHPGNVCILTAEAAQGIVGARTVAQASGWNFAKGKRLTLVALVCRSHPEGSPTGE
jgi:4-amino-4-deoxy-L-arabinose transferase-like glycosyltransferase